MTAPYFAWAVVGDGEPEPVAVKGDPGSRQAFTIGCPDPYNIDEPDCPCMLLPDWEQDAKDNRYIAKVKIGDEREPIKPPTNILSKKVRSKLEKQFRSDLAPRHRYAGFGRRAQQ